MPKTLRLRRAATLSRPLREHGDFFTASIGPSEKAKVACTVSKKVAAKAHERNLLKRRTLSVIRDIPLPKAAVLLSAKRGASQASYQEIERDLKNIFKKISMRHGA